MRVLQIIDSLRAGGAEKMAVNIANALVPHIQRSYLCCTRQEGILKGQLNLEVGYLFLNKKSSIDIPALLKLRNFIKNNQINIVHAHGTSFFIATLIKILIPELKIIWHDHFGARIIKNKQNGILKLASIFFKAVITVNENLKIWSEKNLFVGNIFFVNNFIPTNFILNKNTHVLQDATSFKIIYVSNLKYPKNHLLLLKAFLIVHENLKKVTLHFIGKEFNDAYSNSIKCFIEKNNLIGKVFLYGERDEIGSYLRSADLGIIASSSEGMPLALLEYGLSGLPVISTKVGQCEEVIGGNGILVSPENIKELATAIKFYYLNEEKRHEDSQNFHSRVKAYYSETAVVPIILSVYKKIS